MKNLMQLLAIDQLKNGPSQTGNPSGGGRGNNSAGGTKGGGKGK